MSLQEKALLLKEDFDNVLEAGKNALWDAFTGFGARKTGVRAFDEGDYTAYDEMPYPLVLTDNCQQMFYNYKGEKLPRPQYVDMSGVPRSNDYLYRTFAYWSYARTNEGYVPDYGIQAPLNYRYTFDSSTGLRKIEIIRSIENTKYESTFQKCSRLTDITFEGVIGRDISFSECPLTVESMKSVITHLQDYTGTDSEFTYSVTFSSACLTNLDAEGNTSPNGNSWRQYVGDLGWII